MSGDSEASGAEAESDAAPSPTDPDTSAGAPDAGESKDESEDEKKAVEPEPAPKAEPAPAAKASPAEAGGLKQYFTYLSLFDFARVPDTRAGWVIRALAIVATLTVLSRKVGSATGPMLKAKEPTPIPTEEVDDYRFRLPERTRREIFADLATAELAERARAIQANTWHGHVWSREDDRGHYERVAARAAAAKYKVSLTQVYLVLDEGLRAHWPGPDGKPLPASTPPFSIRSNSW